LSRSGESASGSDENFAEEKTEVLQPASLDEPLFHVLVEKKEPDEEDETVNKRYAYGSGA
jgi:hypothetical protein